MNRTQLPGELKSVICQQVLAGKWTLEEAAEITTFSVQSVFRWLKLHETGGDEAFTKSPRTIATTVTPLDPDLRQALDNALERVPHLRQRSLMAYLLRHLGWKVPRRTVASYLKERGLVEPVQERMESPMRRFEAPAPLDLVQVDLVYVPKLGGGWLYSVNFLDDHSRLILAATALEEQTGKTVLDAFKEVVKKWGRPNRVLTDRGTQFVHWHGTTAFQKYVQNELKSEHILAAARHPQTVGKLERFHRSLKKEGLDPKGYADVKSLQEALDRYLAYYNHERPHQGIGGVVPADRFYGMAQPLQQVWQTLSGWGPDRGVFMALNLLGRRLVLSGPRPDQLTVLWDDQLRPPVSLQTPTSATPAPGKTTKPMPKLKPKRKR